MAKVNHERVLVQGGVFTSGEPGEYYITVWNAKFSIRCELMFELGIKYRNVTQGMVDAEYEEFWDRCVKAGAKFMPLGRLSARLVFDNVASYDAVRRLL